MKKESSGKKSLLWLWIAIAAVVVVAAVVAVLFVTGVLSNSKAPEKLVSEIYWNVDRESMIDPETSLSLREPAEDGLYYVRFAVGGEQVELPIADKSLVNKIDIRDIMCLKFDADGMVIDVVNVEDVYTLIQDKVVVQNVEGNKYLLNSAITFNGMEYTVEIGDNVGVYNMVKSRPEVPGRLFKTGQLDELEVMDTITIYGTDENTPTDIFISNRPYSSKVYWRAEPGQYSAADKRSSRERAEDGFWYIDFMCEGKIETYRTESQAVINALDGYGTIACACSLIFDQEGNIVDCASASYAVRGKVAAASYNVSYLSEDGKTFTVTRLIAGTEAGRTYTGTIGEDTKIYNVNSTGDYLGQEDTLQEGDLLYILSDAMGNPVVIFITNRYVDSPMYYNVSQKYDSKTKQTSRVPDADGWYTIEFAVKGQLKKLRCNDWNIVNQIDTAGTRCMGLKVSGDRILKFYDPACVSGNWSFGSGYFVVSADGVILSCESTTGVVANGVMVDGCEVYDVSGHSEFRGIKTTLREGDRIVGYKNPQGEVTHVYVTARYEAGTSLYWNVNRNTSRKPDADGYYVYKMIKMGKTGYVTLKTNDEKIAKQIDTYNPAGMTLRVNSQGIITKAYNSNAFTIGYEHLSGIHVIGYNDATGRWLLKYRSTGAEANVDLTDVEIYNFSGVYNKAPGERTTLRPGDRIETIYDSHGRMKYAWVYEREYDDNAYWLKDPKPIDSKTGYTSREKAADGYYYFTVAAKGVVKTVKTDDIEIATKLDNTVKNNLCLAFGLMLKDDVVQEVLGAVSVKGIYGSGQSYYDVTAINGNTVTLTRLKPGSSNTGDKQVINISSAKIYEVSSYAGDKWGKETKLTVGDRVQTYIGEDGKTITYVFVAFHNTHEAGAFSYCEHCGEEVFWQPYTGTCDYIKNYSYHYYLTSDYERELSTGWGYTGSDVAYDWVLDLNGFTYRATKSYAYAVRGSSTLTVLDTSKAKTGAITGVGVQAKDAEGNKAEYQSSQAGILRVLDNGTLNLRGGTYTRTVDREITSLRRGGVVVVERDNKTGRFGTLNIYDGAKLVNNTMDTPLDIATDGVTVVRRAPQGGAIYNAGGVINIYGGLISNNGKIHEDFKEFEKTATGNGGNIFNAAGELNIYGGKITNGWCVGNGGNIYVSGGKLTIAGGEISNGTSVNGNTNNIIVAADKNVEVNITGGKVTGDFTISAGNTLKVSGKPEISMGENQGLFLGAGVKAQVGKMESGAKIVLSSTGIFTTDFASTADADAILAKKYFVGESNMTPFYREGKALACGVAKCLNGHTSASQCKAANCDEEILYWNPWLSTNSLPTSGNYYLTGDVTVDASVVAENLVLDLNGFNVTRKVTKAQVAAGEATYVYKADASKKLIVADLSGKTAGTVKVQCEDGVVLTTSAGIFSLATGGELEIYGGNFDGRDLMTSNVNAGGIICGGGKLTVNGGNFYGWSHEQGAMDGVGSIFGGWSTSVVTINNGNFYGGKVKMGGMFATNGKLVINGGTFNGNNSATNTVVDSTKPRTEVTHGGLIYAIDHANSYVEINGGTFVAAKTNTSGGMIYTSADAGGKTVMKITGGTFTASSKAQNGGFIRFRGKDLTISGVALEGFAVSNAANADIVSFEGTGTLTIGKDAVVDGGIMVKSGSIVLKDNVKIGKGTNYSIKLSAGTTMDLNGLTDGAQVHVQHTDVATAFATIADEATAQKLVNNKLVVSRDETYVIVANGKDLGVIENPDWREWTSDNSLPTSGKFYLTKDVQIDARVNLSGDLVLDLNGYTITRVVKADSADYGVYNVVAGNLEITDLSSGAAGTVKTIFDTGVTEVSGTGAMAYVGAGKTLTITAGNFDFRGFKTTNDKATGCGPIVADGNVVINGGTFYGHQATAGHGGLFSGRSASTLTINGGTFYGGNVYQGGMFASTGKIVINDGLFDGNNSASNTAVDAEKPRTVATHGGLIVVQNNANAALTINGGTFKAGHGYNSGGMIYVEANTAAVVNINGGTFSASSKAQNGGFIRFRGKDLNISGVTLEGFAVSNAANADIVSFEGSGKLTIGKDAVVDGGIMVKSGSIVLKDNVKIGKGTTCAINLAAGTTMDLNGLTDGAQVYVQHNDPSTSFATVADEATAQKLVDDKLVVSRDDTYVIAANGKDLTVAINTDWRAWTSDNSLPDSGKFYLTKDVTITEAVVVSGNLELDLKGFDITRTVTEQQITDAAKTQVFYLNAGAKLIIRDSSVENASTEPGTVKIVLPKDADDNIIPITSSAGIISIQSGASAEIFNGIYDGREVISTTTASGGIFCGDSLTIHDGVFYGMSNAAGATAGNGTIYGGWSTSTLTINNGTFYGAVTKQGGMFASTGKIIINDGLFDGNNSASNTAVDAEKPRTVATHGGLILVQAHNNAALTINGGTFKSAQGYNSGGIIYVEANNKIVVNINGGTFTASSKAQNGGFIRFRGKDLNISGVTLEGFAVTTVGNADTVSFEGSGKLTIGKDAVIDGGVMIKSGTGVVLQENAKVNAGTNCGLSLGTATMDISNLNSDAKVYVNWTDTTKAFAEAADEATAKALVDNKVIVSADDNYRVIADGKNLTVKVQIQWNEWNAAAAATMFGGAEADNLHLTKLPTTGDYKLIADVTIDARVAMTGNVNLNLNGHTATRVIKSGAADYGFYTTNAKGNLYITDEIKFTDASATIGTMQTVFNTGVTTCAGTGFLGYIGTGYTLTIDEGVFDFRGVKTTNTATTGCGPITADGTVIINGGTFYGTNAASGYGGMISGRSGNKTTINGGTFIGASGTRGGLISAKNIEINGGLLDGNNNGSNQKINAEYPAGKAGAHGGLIHATGTVTITGGTFQNGFAASSGGGLYAEGTSTVTITGGTFQNCKGGTTGGNMRCDGTLTITGATITGGTATNGNNVSYCSAKTLTIGQDAVIDGGIETRTNETGTKIVLVGNAKVNAATAGAYSLRLANTTVHIGDAANAAVATAGATITDYVATYDASNNVTGVAN